MEQRRSELDKIRDLPDAAARAKAAAEYVTLHQGAVTAGLQVRDAAVVALAAEVGPSAAAAHVGMSRERLRQVRRDYRG
jgi:hypothetical protein